MSQFGMQMPGGRARRGASLDVYTALMFLACIALLAACAFVFVQAGKVGPGGKAFSLQQDGRIELKQRGQ